MKRKVFQFYLNKMKQKKNVFVPFNILRKKNVTVNNRLAAISDIYLCIVEYIKINLFSRSTTIQCIFQRFFF